MWAGFRIAHKFRSGAGKIHPFFQPISASSRLGIRRLRHTPTKYNPPMLRAYQGISPTIPASCYVDLSAQVIGDVLRPLRRSVRHDTGVDFRFCTRASGKQAGGERCGKRGDNLKRRSPTRTRTAALVMMFCTQWL